MGATLCAHLLLHIGLQSKEVAPLLRNWNEKGEYL